MDGVDEEGANGESSVHIHREINLWGLARSTRWVGSRPGAFLTGGGVRYRPISARWSWGGGSIRERAIGAK